MFLLLNDGKTQREIAEFIGCSLKTVGSILLMQWVLIFIAVKN